MPQILMPGDAIPLSVGSGLSPVVVGSGLIQDNSDSTYVESVRRVWGHFASGQDRFEDTPGYVWEFVPASSVPVFGNTNYHVSRVRAKIELVTKQIEYNPGGVQTIGFAINRISDGLVITDVSSFQWDVEDSGVSWANGALQVGVPTWITLEKELSEGPYEALRTGTYPGYGDVRLGFGWFGSPGFTPHNDVGDENRIRLYEYYVELRPGGWSVGENLISF